MDVEGGLATSYGDVKRYLLTPITKQHPLPRMLYTHIVVHLWLVLAKDALLSICSEIKTLQGSVLWPFLIWLGRMDASVLLAR